MLLCDDCHDPRRHWEALTPRSIGTCEACGRRRACIDCRVRHCQIVKTPGQLAAERAFRRMMERWGYDPVTGKPLPAEKEDDGQRS